MRFVFVHGGFHAAWCWDRAIAELTRLGHDGVAVDLPGHGALVDEESTLANRREAIVAAIQPGDVLVGDSGGGFDATLDADVGEMLSYLTFDDDGAMTFTDFDGAWRYFYHDCDEATARWAFDRLGPERFGDTTVTPVSVPNFWAADLPRSFIRCLQDQSMPRWLADTVTERLGVEQLSIDTSHSPFLSRPRELAELLVHATTTTPIAPLVPH